MYPFGGGEMIRFIHAADLHLDTPFSGIEKTSKELAEKLRQAPYDSLANIVDLAIERTVDFVLFSGDLYNTKRINIKAQSLFIEQMNRLNSADIKVFVIRGNHDYLTESEHSLTLPFPDNVYTFGADVSTHIIETRQNQRVAITGFSYETQWVFNRKIQAYPKREPNVNLHIGMLHGSADSITSTEANYAPFTLRELQEKNYDYWALGHIHQRQELAPNIHYPGNIQGLHKNEVGEKGCLLIEWDDHNQQTEFIPTAPIIWQSVDLDISSMEHVAELFEALRGEMENLSKKEEKLIHLTLKSNEDYNEKLIELIQEPTFNEQMTRQMNDDRIWIVTIDFVLDEINDTQTLENRYPEMWQKAVEKAISNQSFTEMTEGIFNQIPQKYLTEENSEAYRQKMIEKAMAKIHLK